MTEYVFSGFECVVTTTVGGGGGVDHGTMTHEPVKMIREHGAVDVVAAIGYYFIIFGIIVLILAIKRNSNHAS